MLKNIPKNISPELLKVLDEMGHGDEIVLSDGNFPSERINDKVVRCDSTGVTDLLKSILVLFPLDTDYSDEQVFLMEVTPGDTYKPEIWEDYKKVLDESKENYTIGNIERFKFYERAKEAFAVVHTGETALYANIILKKGVVK
ncbi:MAG: L-fucose mutarotase [Anaerococcus vaginalis]|uniref:L-fucose mutarotase n=1 Tax=Anaerococcus TaxID=165779 RepID=UPI0002D81699|nr:MULTISPECIES: L-fucose mutarotase [Anaerococcus]MBS4888974.1 L-fucose mutarotase [Anaerococcus vaginalis]MDD7766189.1 L-fucose mutarotase [Anaerococcus vaginalis]MDU0945089.1 L-fucose mutarotase [Anaerococcus vaginalis]MDU1030372.1 L-fucose mutarotase [Anaerococcus vaginalis]MDU4378795.1 L-fucose mutarotase [Anaerococcus vaginalis]